MDNIEMLKALYDFQAVYPKTISFDEGEYFILYQTSARQRNWWQVVSMKGNIGFVPSNYVMKIKVEPDFLISFLNSSIESLEKSKEVEINGIMQKDELLERLRGKKIALEKLYLDSSERDNDSSFSFSHSIGEKNIKNVRSSNSNGSSNTIDQDYKHQPSSPQFAHTSKRLDSNKKSMSSPTVGAALPHMIQESPSMGSMQAVQCSSTTSSNNIGGNNANATTSSTSSAAVAASAAVPAVTTAASSSKANDIAQDNSITSEPSETTTTTTTTSEDVVTTYKESSLQAAAISTKHAQQNGNTINGGRRASSSNRESGGSGAATSDLSEQISDDKLPATEHHSDASDGPAVVTGNSDTGACDYAQSAENSQALEDSEDSIALERKRLMLAATATSAYPRENLKVESSDVYQIVDVIRRNTNLSFDLSCEALRVVLTSLEQLYNGEINPYLEAVAVHVTEKVETPKELLGITHDSKRLQYIFAQLADCKNDSEQRTWMLYEDEDDIIQFLEELVEILKNADENICCYEMSCDHYMALVNLVLYYQMETRWPIKLLLLKAFTAACHLDHLIVDILLTSVLPLEIVEDMKTNFSNLEKFKELVKMLTILFSLGLAMPVNDQDYLGVHFASFLLEIVEGNNPESLVDMVIALILAFNLQFTDFTQNVVIEAMQSLPTAKVFTEKILLLLNREEDPIKILKHSTDTMNSVLKMFIDLFSVPDTAGMFYTNDNKVLIDILVRQLSDLCAGNPIRRCYLELCRRILRNTNYQEHQHRKQDLMKIFTRIFCEETECSASDQQLVREIANEFPQLFKA